MKNHSRIFVQLMLVGNLALALPAGAQPNPDDMPHCGGPMGAAGIPALQEEMPPAPFLHGLKLSEEQRDKIFDLMHALAPTMRNLAKSIHKSRMELRQLGLSGEYSAAKAKALAETNAQAMAKMAQIHASIDNQIYQVLTQAQRKQLEKRRARPDSPSVDHIE